MQTKTAKTAKTATICTVAKPAHSNCHGNTRYDVVWVADANNWMVDTNEFGLFIDPRDVAHEIIDITPEPWVLMQLLAGR